MLLLVIFWMKVVTRVKGTGLPGRHVQVHLLMTFRIQASNAEEMENIAPPFLRRSWGVRWASLAIFFLDSGVG